MLTALAAMPVSCNKIPSESGQGSLCWNFSEGLPTRALTEVPDTDTFILTVKNSAQEVLYQGFYGDSPESMLVNPGTYTVKAVSRTFNSPEFDAPQFGDEQVAVVKAGASTRVLLDCAQLNCGLRLRLDPEFGSVYPDGSVKVSSREGTLDYGKSESRTGFFMPGDLTVILVDGSESTRLVTKSLAAREILTLGISCPSSRPSSDQSGISISVDTSRVWNSGDYTIGSDPGDTGATKENAYGVAQAKEHVGEKSVWVCGYIVGGDLSSTKNGIKFEGPFSSMTNIAIAARSSVDDKASCMSVQLAKGDIREALNLVDNPGLLGRKVRLRGNIESSYYGIPGLKDLTEYSFD